MSREQVVEFCKTITAETDVNELLEFAASVDIDYSGVPVQVYMAVGGNITVLATTARDRRNDPKLSNFLDTLSQRLLGSANKKLSLDDSKALDYSCAQWLIEWNNRTIEVCQEIGREDLIEYFQIENAAQEKRR